MTTECGCVPPDANQEYLLVKATAGEAFVCPSEDVSPTADCPKQEPIYDISTGSFLVPSNGNSATITVCNSAIYTVGMWIQFVNTKITLQITGITTGTLSVINACSNGNIILDNVAGYVISQSARFTVSSSPPGCAEEDNGESDIEEYLSSAEELCVESMEIASATAHMAPVGRVSSDENNLGVGKCLRRIYGFLMEKGTPLFNVLEQVAGEDYNNYRRLVIGKSSHKVKEIENYGDYASVVSGKQYTLGVTNGAENLAGPVYFSSIFEDEVIMEDADWVLSGSSDREWDEVLDMSAVADITKNLDHYYADIRLEVEYQKNSSGVEFEFLANTKSCLKIHSISEYNVYANASVPVKVLVADNKLSMKVTYDGAGSQYKLKLILDGIRF